MIIKGLRAITLILFYSFLSWILVHLLAVFGVFISLAYPIWWAVMPQKTLCFSCRSTRQGKKCKFCNKAVDKKDPTYPHITNLRSAILNAFVILAFTAISVLLVYGEAKLLNRLGIPPTSRTVSFVIPPKGQYRLGEIFPMRIEIVGIETPINAIQADISFDSAIVEVVDINTSESFANVFIQKEINNEAGYARLTGGLPNPGFFSDHGVFGTVWFKSKTPGIVKVDFLPTSMVLANDGKGTNVLKEFASVNYLILPEPITTQEEQLQKKLLIPESSESDVLGESTNKTQIKLYSEYNVLGAVSESTVEEQVEQTPEKKTGIFTSILCLIEKFDSFVVKVLHKIL